jgi:hypothetical protein
MRLRRALRAAFGIGDRRRGLRADVSVDAAGSGASSLGSFMVSVSGCLQHAVGRRLVVSKGADPSASPSSHSSSRIGMWIVTAKM